MKSNSLKYLVKEGTSNVWLNRLMSLASIGVLTTCLLLIGFSWLITVNIASIVDYLGDQNQVIVFLKSDAPADDISSNYQSLMTDSRLYDVQHITKEQAMDELSKKMEGSAALLQGLQGSENPLPESYRFKVKEISQTSAIVAELKKIPIVDQVNAPTDVADTITNVRDMVNAFSVVLIAVLAVVSLVIISNTIRATVFSRRKEINIMKYVGATNNFIRIPFFVEGVIIGILSALIAYGLIWLGYDLLLSYFSDHASAWLKQLMGYLLPFARVEWQLLGCFIGAGILTGAVGCLFSIRKHLKV